LKVKYFPFIVAVSATTVVPFINLKLTKSSSASQPFAHSALKVIVFKVISSSVAPTNLNFKTSTFSSPNLGLETEPSGSTFKVAAATQPIFIVLPTKEPSFSTEAEAITSFNSIANS
jgi:hypothetical protein